MKTRMLIIAVALLAFASLSMGQATVYWVEDPVYYNPLFLGLKCPCTGGAMIPVGVTIDIQWKQGDTMWVKAPTSESNPNAVNINEIQVGPDAGYFSPMDLMYPLGGHPVPQKFRLVVRYCCAPPGALGDSVVWTSAECNVVPDLYQEICPSLIGSWTCVTYVCGSQPTTCVPHRETWFPNHEGTMPPTPGPRNFDDCVVLCPGFDHTICIGPHMPHEIYLIPHVTVFAGCEPIVTPCDSICPPAAGYIWNNGQGFVQPGWVWTEIPVGSGLFYYCNKIIMPETATPGCVCIFYDWKWPVEMKSSDFLALDNAVKVNWETASETNVDLFKIMRDDAVVGTVNATNEANGHVYSYTDETATNGTTYNYKLVVVGLDGAENVVATESVTPSFENAIVTEYKLHQNYPNPFNPTTRIAFDVLNANPVNLTVYNATGQVVATLLNNANYSTGRYSVDFNAVNLTSGLYFYTVKIGNEFTATKKMLLVK